ncbi:MAG: TIGR04086 family membrane protein [Clostridia bacterium]|nr:TIGR04086 family membrane protein [Clostridia bacterium]
MKIKALKLKPKKIKKIKEEQTSPSIWVSVLKGALISLAVSLIGILIFAFFIKYIAISTSAIKPINQVIKGISLLIGTFIALKSSDKMGLMSGLLIGIVYTFLAFIVFSILNGNFEITKVLANDILFGAIIGAICGVIAVNIRKK